MARETPTRISDNGDSHRKCPLCGRPMTVLHTSIGYDSIAAWPSSGSVTYAESSSHSADVLGREGFYG